MPVHGRVHTTGSSMVNWYASVSGPVRVYRSVIVSASLDPWYGALPLKLRISTTSVSPSQRPRASPSQEVMSSPTCGLSSVGTTRVS